MRASLFIVIFTILLGLFLWATLSGALFIFGAMFWALFVIITVSYPDTVLLFLLGARELRSSDEKSFFEAASQEAYKLSVPMPRLYFYNGALERAFVFQKRDEISIVLNKSLLEKSTADELCAICFELLLQVKKGMAPKRTKSMFVLGLLAWAFHSLVALLGRFIPFKEFRQASDWFVNYLFHPFLDLLFKMIMGEGYFKKLENYLNDYPEEKNLLGQTGLKLRKPLEYYSLPSRKLLELSSISKSRHFQNIMALEFLPHEWDYLFSVREK